MKKQLFDLTIEEFTRLLLEYPERIELQINKYEENGTRKGEEADILVGTYEELNNLAEDFAPNHPVRISMQNILNALFDYNMQLNRIDIYNYLEHITSNFNAERVRIVLNEMDCFYLMTYLEYIDEEVQNKYIENGWDFPLREVDFSKIGKGICSVTDYKAMRENIYPCREFMYHTAISLLKRKLQPIENEVPDASGRTMKVTTDVLIELLDKAGFNENNSDKTKISKFIAYITGFSENTIRQRMTNREELTSKHKDEVEKINKILSELNIDISIKYNKKR